MPFIIEIDFARGQSHFAERGMLSYLPKRQNVFIQTVEA